MTIAELTAQDEQESTPVLEWRFSQLTRTDVDLHRAADLVARGCPPSVALRILL